MLNLYIGYVIDVSDRYHAERIKAVIETDKSKPVDEIPWAFPAIPKMVHVKPKVGEAVLVLVGNDGDENAQRYYLGPIISQPQNFFYDDFASYSATKMLSGGLAKPLMSVNDIPLATDVFPKNDEVAILSRKNSEIILSDDDIRLRAGVRNTDPVGEKVISSKAPSIAGVPKRLQGTLGDESSYRIAPAFIKIAKHETPLLTSRKTGEINPHLETRSTVTIVGDKINLISPNGDGAFNLTGEGDGVSDEKMKQIIEKAHKLPYGDVLCEFFSEFLKMYKKHFHRYPGWEPSESETNAQKFWEKYSLDKNKLEDKLLSKDIAIN